MAGFQNRNRETRLLQFIGEETRPATVQDGDTDRPEPDPGGNAKLAAAAGVGLLRPSNCRVASAARHLRQTRSW